jgi:hypothetical protein
LQPSHGYRAGNLGEYYRNLARFGRSNEDMLEMIGEGLFEMNDRIQVWQFL